jgi:hypothetical protein
VALTPALRPGVNGVWVMFMDSTLRSFYEDWEEAARDAIGRLRLLVGRDVHDPAFGELVRELSENSEDFRRLWPRQDIKATPPNSRILNHPAVGRLELFPQVLEIAGADRQDLYIRHTEPGSPSELALNRLAEMEGGAEPDPASSQ